MKSKIKQGVIGLFLLASVHAHAQWLWADDAGGTANDAGNSIVQDAHGNTYVTGSFSSPTINFGNGITLTNSGAIDYYLVKYSSSGLAQWAQGATGVSNDVGYNVTLDATGSNVYVVGNTNSASITFPVGGTLVNNGHDDVFIAKYSSAGVLQWVKLKGGSSDDIGEKIAVDGSGNAYISGYFASSSVTFGPGISVANAGGFSGTDDIFIAKFDVNGNALWAQRAGGTANDAGMGIAVDGSGSNVYATGYYSSTSVAFGATPALVNSGGQDFFIVKYNSSGTAQWANTAVGTLNDVGNDVKVDVHGNVRVVGTYNSSTLTFSGLTPLSNNGGSDIFTLFYTPAGVVQWANGAGGSGNDVGSSVSLDIDANAYITGYFGSSTISFGAPTTPLTNAGSNDIYVATYSSSGASLLAISAGGASDDRGTGVCIDLNGDHFVLTGYYSSPTLSLGTINLTNNGLEDMFVGSFNVATFARDARPGTLNIISTDTPADLNKEFLVYPNPATGILNVEYQKQNETDVVQIINTLGQDVMQVCMQQNKASIDISNLQRGIYFIRTSQGIRKFIKQ